MRVEQSLLAESWNPAYSRRDFKLDDSDPPFLKLAVEELTKSGFFGDTAVVQGSAIWTRKRGRKWRFIWKDIWLRRKGQWQMVASEDVSVPIKS